MIFKYAKNPTEISDITPVREPLRGANLAQPLGGARLTGTTPAGALIDPQSGIWDPQYDIDPVTGKKIYKKQGLFQFMDNASTHKGNQLRDFRNLQRRGILQEYEKLRTMGPVPGRQPLPVPYSINNSVIYPEAGKREFWQNWLSGHGFTPDGNKAPYSILDKSYVPEFTYPDLRMSSSANKPKINTVELGGTNPGIKRGGVPVEAKYKNMFESNVGSGMGTNSPDIPYSPSRQFKMQHSFSPSIALEHAKRKGILTPEMIKNPALAVSYMPASWQTGHAKYWMGNANATQQNLVPQAIKPYVKPNPNILMGSERPYYHGTLPSTPRGVDWRDSFFPNSSGTYMDDMVKYHQGIGPNPNTMYKPVQPMQNATAVMVPNNQVNKAKARAASLRMPGSGNTALGQEWADFVGQKFPTTQASMTTGLSDRLPTNVYGDTLLPDSQSKYNQAVGKSKYNPRDFQAIDLDKKIPNQTPQQRAATTARLNAANQYSPARAMEHMTSQGLSYRSPQEAVAGMPQQWQLEYQNRFLNDQTQGPVRQSVLNPTTRKNYPKQYPGLDVMQSRYHNKNLVYGYQPPGTTTVNPTNPAAATTTSTATTTTPSRMSRIGRAALRGVGTALGPIGVMSEVARMGQDWSKDMTQAGMNPNNTFYNWAQSEAERAKGKPWYGKVAPMLNTLTGQTLGAGENAAKLYKNRYDKYGPVGPMIQAGYDTYRVGRNIAGDVKDLAQGAVKLNQNSGKYYGGAGMGKMPIYLPQREQAIAPALANVARTPVANAGRAIEYTARAPERERASQISNQRAQNLATSMWSEQGQRQSTLPKPVNPNEGKGPLRPEPPKQFTPKPAPNPYEGVGPLRY